MKWSNTIIRLTRSLGGTVAVNGEPDAWCVLDCDPALVGGAVKRVFSRPGARPASEWKARFEDRPRVRDDVLFREWLQCLLASPAGRKKPHFADAIRLLCELRLSGVLLWPAAQPRLPHPCPGSPDGARFHSHPGLTPFELELISTAREYKAAYARALLMSCSPARALDELSDEALGTVLEVATRADVWVTRWDSNKLLTLYRLMEGRRKQDGSTFELLASAEQLLRERGVRGRKAPGYGAAACRDDAKPWVHAFEMASSGQLLKMGKTQSAAHTGWLDFLTTFDTIPQSPSINRATHIVGPAGYLAWVRARYSATGGTVNDDLHHLSGLFEMLVDAGLMSENPVRQSDFPPDRQQNGKSNKVILPREVLSCLREVLRELLALAYAQADALEGQAYRPAGLLEGRARPTTPSGPVRAGDGEWEPLPVLPATMLRPKGFERLYVNLRAEDGAVVRVINPTLPALLETELTLPLRTVQARCLDSGEADEMLPEVTITAGQNGLDPQVSVLWVHNPGALATKGRKQGFLRSIDDPMLDYSILGFWVNTNKSQLGGHLDGADRGYKVPWEHRELIATIVRQRDWQVRFNPPDRLRARDELREAQFKPSRGLAGQLPRYVYLFRHLQNQDISGRHEPPSHVQVHFFFCMILDEVEARLAVPRSRVGPGQQSRPAPKLVLDRNDRGLAVRCVYSLHGLRATGITAFAEAGIPLPIIGRFLSGHTALMALYYTLPGPAAVMAALSGAHAFIERGGPQGAADEAARMTAAQLARRFVANGGAAAFEFGDQVAGLWVGSDCGICPNGMTRCNEGGPLIAGTNRYGPVPGGSRNCALCRFHLTGPRFLAGQVNRINAKLYQARRSSGDSGALGAAARPRQRAPARLLRRPGGHRRGSARHDVADDQRHDATAAQEHRPDVDGAPGRGIGRLRQSVGDAHHSYGCPRGGRACQGDERARVPRPHVQDRGARPGDRDIRRDGRTGHGHRPAAGSGGFRRAPIQAAVGHWRGGGERLHGRPAFVGPGRSIRGRLRRLGRERPPRFIRPRRRGNREGNVRITRTRHPPHEARRSRACRGGPFQAAGVTSVPVSGEPPDGDDRFGWKSVKDTLDEALAGSRSERGSRSLRSIYEAMVVLNGAGHAITFKSVAQQCKRAGGGPVSQSIQNSRPSADLVRAGQAAQATRLRPRPPKPFEEEVLARFPELDLRARVATVFAQLRRATAARDVMAAALRRMEALRVITAEMAETDLDTLEQLASAVAERQASSGGPSVDEVQRAGCRRFLEGLSRLNLTVDESSGEILDRSARTFAPPGVLSALRAVALGPPGRGPGQAAGDIQP